MAIPVARRNLFAEEAPFTIPVARLAFAVIKVRHRWTEIVKLIVAEKAVIA